MENKLKQILAAVLQTKIENIDNNSSADTMEAWDSLSQMNLIVALEEQFNIEFDDEEIVMLNSYDLILASIKSKLKK